MTFGSTFVETNHVAMVNPMICPIIVDTLRRSRVWPCPPA